jgi:hypothetical protein
MKRFLTPESNEEWSRLMQGKSDMTSIACAMYMLAKRLELQRDELNDAALFILKHRGHLSEEKVIEKLDEILKSHES